jgi:hypothetical protein
VIFSSRPPPSVLIVHADGGGQASIGYFAAAGLRVASTPSVPIAEIVECVMTTRPDMIVLDYDCEGGVIEGLKGDARTAAIPIIALAELPVPPLPPGVRDTTSTASVS